MASGSQNMTTYLAKGVQKILTTNAINTDNLLYINTADTNITADMLGATTSIAFTRASITGAYTTGHMVWLNAADIGTPFQLVVHDSSDLYLYKRWKSSGAWTDWTKISAGHADTAAALESNAGGTEQPIYFTGGKPAATSYALKATVNNSTSGYMAYYSGDRAISGTSNIRATSAGSLSIFPSGGSYRDGIRIHARTSDNTWAAILLCGADNTGDSGTSANSWFIGNSDGNLYFGRNGTGGSGTFLRCVSDVWAWNGTASGSISGNAATATALTSNAGGGEQPIYFTGGKPAATSYALKATVNAASVKNTFAYYSDTHAISSYPRIRNIGSARYPIDIYVYNDAGNLISEMWYDAGDATNVTRGQWNFLSESPNSTNNTGTTGKYEYFYLPNVDTGRTTNAGYAIRTSKDNNYTVSNATTAASCTGNAATATKATQDGSGNTITSYYVTLSTDQTITGTKTFQKRIIAYGYKQATNLPFMTFDKPGSNAAGIGPDGTNNRIKFGPCDLAGTAWTAQSSFNSNQWFFQGSIYGTSTLTIESSATITGGITSQHGHVFNVGGNEFNWIPDGYNSTMWFNYESFGRTNNSTVSEYICGNGKHGHANLRAAKVYNAVWNDFAEYREGTTTEAGRVVAATTDSNIVSLTYERLQPCAHVISDTFGCSVGQSDTAQTPIGVGGRVLVYPYQPRENYKVGDVLCAAPNGTADIMTREEIIQYPDRIIGIVDEIPNYLVWKQTLTTDKEKNGGGKVETNVQVNGRIWIYVR